MIVFITVSSIVPLILLLVLHMVRMSGRIDLNFSFAAAGLDQAEERRKDEDPAAAEQHSRRKFLLEKEDVREGRVHDGHVGDHAANGGALGLERDAHRDEAEALDAGAAEEDAELLRSQLG